MCLATARKNVEATAATPNIVLFSVDDSILPSTWQAVYEDTVVASGARNPNGCRMPLTWFVSTGNTQRSTADCEVVQQAREAGHEMASHSVSHSDEAKTFSYERWAQEMDGQREWMAGCGVPAKEVVGWRAPYFLINAVMGQVLADKGFLYDSSVSGKDPSRPAFPFTHFDPAAPCDASSGTCGAWAKHDGIWEVPAYLLPGRGGAIGRRVDPSPSDDMGVLERLKADFQRKRGSGVPVWLGVHEKYISAPETRDPAVAFFSWALRQPNTWALTYRQYVEWRQAPPGTSVASIVARYPCDASGQRRRMQTLSRRG